jgi:hypothetical protein
MQTSSREMTPAMIEAVLRTTKAVAVAWNALGRF